MTEVLPPLHEGTPPSNDQPPERPPNTGRRAVVAVAGLLAVFPLGIEALALHPTRGPMAPPSPAPVPSASAGPTGSPSPTATPSPSTPSPSTPSPTARPSPTGPPAAPPDAVTAVWPPPSSGVRYPTPIVAARGFALDLVGFQHPVLGSYRAADARSGEVDVRPEAGGQVTTVLVRSMSDDTWWVLGAATDGIELDTPGAGDVVGSPVVLTGRAWAFEGHVSVRIVEDGSPTPLATGFVTGGGDTLRPFTGSFPLGTVHATHGAVVLTTERPRRSGTDRGRRPGGARRTVTARTTAGRRHA